MNFGLVGAGGIGAVRGNALRATPGCRLAAVADLDPVRSQRVAAGARCFGHYRELLAAPEVEAVVVSTPPPSHEEIVTAALEAGKHVLCEKPLAPHPEAARRMVEAARRAGRVLTTGFNHRYFPAVKFLKRALDSGRLGKLDHVRAFAGHEGLSQFSAPWMYDKEVIGGGALMDVGIHLIDLVRYLLGEVSQVYGVASGRVWGLPAEDNGIAILRSPGGVPATLHATWSEWKGYRFYVEAYGDRGMARAYYAPMFALAVCADRPGGLRRREFHFFPRILLREKIRGWQTTTSLAFQEELRDFVRLAAGDTRVALADGFAGWRAIQIAHAVYRSSATGQVITLE
jgi:predicted dehydrogenase